MTLTLYFEIEGSIRKYFKSSYPIISHTMTNMVNY